jgi:hypothetical protein
MIINKLIMFKNMYFFLNLNLKNTNYKSIYTDRLSKTILKCILKNQQQTKVK